MEKILIESMNQVVAFLRKWSVKYDVGSQTLEGCCMYMHNIKNDYQSILT